MNLLLRPRLVTGLSFAIGILFVGAATLWQARENHAEAQRALDTRAQDIANQVAARLKIYEYGLLSARGAFIAAGGEQLSREAFRNYSASQIIGKEFPGARGFGIIKRVAPANEARFVAAARRDGRPNFTIRQLAAHAGELYVIQYIEPIEANRQAVGLDIASEANRKTAALTSMHNGAATLTGPITLVQAAARPSHAFLLMLPIYRPAASIETPAERALATVGWAYTPLVIDEVLQGLVSSEAARQYSLKLRDVAGEDTQNFFTSPGSDPTHDKSLSRRVSIVVYGRTWEAEIAATPRFFTALGQRASRDVAVAGSALSVLLAVLAGLFADAAVRRNHIAIENRRRAAIVQGSSDAIVGHLLDGTVTDWNPAAERLFGYGAAEAVGRMVSQLIIPEDREKEDMRIRATVAHGEWVPPFDTTRQHRDGTLIEVSVTASPIQTEDGRCVGLSKTVRDISETRRAERALAALNASLEQQVSERTAQLEGARHTLETILNSVPSQIGYWDKQLINHVANRAYRDWFGVEPENLRGKHMRWLLGDKIYDENVPSLQAALRGETQSFYGSPISRPDGKGHRRPLVNYLPDIVEGEVRGIFTFVYDVTELIEGQLKLSDARRDLRTIVDALPSMIGYWDKHLHNRVANKAYSDWFNVDPGKLEGHHMREVLGDELFERNRPYAEAALRGERQNFERAIPKPDGSGVRHSLCHYLPDIVDNEVRGFYVLVHDVTELVEGRLKLAEVQRDGQALLQTIQKHSILSVVDPEGRITDANDKFCSISGYTREDLLGRTHNVIESGVHGRQFWGDMWHTISSGQSWRDEVCNRAKDGSLYWVNNIIAPFLDDDGKVEKYIAIGSNITARKHAEAALLETSTLLTSVLASALDVSIIAARVDGVITIFNQGAQRLTGYTEADMVGQRTPALLHLESEVTARSAELSAEFNRSITGFGVFVHMSERLQSETREWTYVRKDGSHVPVLLTVTAMRDARGEIYGYLGIAHDISQQKQYEDSLREAMHKAEDANRAKSQFLANMSHEIRTPMNAVIGLSYLLERTALDRNQADTLAKIKLASRSLLSIINDVLDLSKIEASELHLECAPFSLAVLLGELRDLMTVEADAKGISCLIDVPENLPRLLEGDVTRLRQVLTNLLSNAIKFTEHGTVRLQVQVQANPDDAVQLRFVINDTGIGIKPEALERLFAPFAQADTSTTRRFGGTGLGLSIVKQLVTMMGGTLGVTSSPQVGSEFWVALTFSVCVITDPLPAYPAESPSLTPNLRGVRVLIADDSTINLEVARRILELEGATVTLAHNGQEAIDHLLARPDTTDIILMDVQMPVLDGYNATRRIRSGLGLTLPIIALTAGLLSSEQQEAEASGMQDFITKPFDPLDLVRCILRHLQRTEATAVAPPPDMLADEEWPEIAGIDSRDSSRRLGGDVPLLRTALRQFLNYFADVGNEQATNAAALPHLMTRMHSLKGSAGMLGAKGLQHLATQTETACRSGDVDQVAGLLEQLTAQMEVLCLSALPWLDGLLDLRPDQPAIKKLPEN